ncbi:MAG: hypothetical protein WDZ35_04465 [Crocinitomicaceae bacterium]
MNDNIHYQKGMSKVNENQFAEAIEYFNLAIAEEGENPFFYNQRAVCYLNLEQYELSLFDMNKSIELDEKYAYFYSCRGFLKARMRDMEGALMDYESSLELDPDNDITYNNMGLLLEQMGNMSRAEYAFKKGNDILGYDPKNRKLSADQKMMVDKGETEAEAEPEIKITTSRKQIAKDVFSKRSAFREFIAFIANGFKLKKDDKSRKG